MGKHWYDTDSEARWAGGIGKWAIFFVLLVLLLGGIVWGVRTALAPVTGQGDAFRQKESGNNRIAAQERFEDLYADIKATDAKLDGAKAKVRANKDSQVALTEYTGLVNYCLDVVGDYNAEARKYTSEQFRAVDLPEQIDTLDPSTDCKETQK